MRVGEPVRNSYTIVILFAVVNMSVLFGICAVAVGAISAHG